MLSKLYLISYNALMVLGWSYLAILILSSGDVLNLGGTLYPRISLVLKIFQTGALLEIIHAAIKIVKSNVVIVACQVYSRIMVLWLILVMFQITQTKLALSLLLFAWTTTEIIRYSFYALNLLGTHSQMVTYLRYTLFIVLYPIGITGELLSMYYALPEVARNNTFSILLPNKYNFTFSFYYFLIINMLLYIPVFPKLYGHMLKQRKKVLG
ncbi:very-long-chain (3R)-3-hydroxyacyl-CoA dehydratase 2 [Lepeophtheirus salmonis]|uniref:Very-long-chain (3R)-3-hydroxyacyl-CoA dehydratase n=1 Tax=Lepeophtheirus salmonis TaxID=72036 RepID=A0A0K2TL01_LEPSM|nr:very-long-chain (3R)-3-hydroxyacyl-CoA dehydratase 2-like [Lepeophtheirus salmonis]